MSTIEIIITLVFFVIAMSMHGSHAYNRGIAAGAETAIDILHERNIIAYDESGEIVAVKTRK